MEEKKVIMRSKKGKREKAQREIKRKTVKYI
jgi:hypothetical protein